MSRGKILIVDYQFYKSNESINKESYKMNVFCFPNHDNNNKKTMTIKQTGK